MAIACAYCNGEHATPAEVRRCWQDQGRPTLDLDDQPVPSEPPRSSARSDRAAPSPPPALTIPFERGAAIARAGPEALGRHVLLAPGADVPEPWAFAERIVVDDATLGDPGAALGRLRAAHHAGERLVIELAAAFEREPMLMTDAQPHRLGPRFAFDLEELHHLVWSNSVDRRSPERPQWVVLDRAIAAGATPVDDGPGDVRLPDGKFVWLDGGPVRHHDPIDGVAVLHSVAVEHRSWAVPTSNESTAELAHDQLAAVTHRGAGARIIAPAGSGKTRVLTERARHLVTSWNLPTAAISLVAFNKRAQLEIEERTRDLPGLHVRTLNSIALAIVNGTPPFHPQPRTWRTINEPDVRRIIGDLVAFPRRRNSDPIGPWIEALSAIRLGLADPGEVEARYDGDVDGLAATWPAFRSALERRGAVDFDDQIHRALLVLLTDPLARRAAQRACRVMLVDEFQDLTPAHLLLIRLLSAPGGAVFGVGDDDQTIYGYNGADPGWLIDFAELFPGSGDHPLEVNYRCPAGVVEAVDRLLRHNRRRVAKVIRAASTDVGGWSVDRSIDAVGAARRTVATALAAGVTPSELAVLVRVNALLAPIQVALVVEGVPISGGVGAEFADRTAVRAVLAWLRLALAGGGGFAADDLREAMRRRAGSFHPRIVEWIAEQRSVVDLFRLAGRLTNERDADRLQEFAADIQTLQRAAASGATTSDLVDVLVDEIGLAGAVATLDANRRGMNRAAQGDDLTAMMQLAALHDDASTFERWLRAHLTATRSPEGVVLSTVHRVKGQEWPHVVVHLAAADQYPHRLAEDVEEERRLFHVAITRASRQATIVTGARPSPFVDELTTEPSAGSTVSPHRLSITVSTSTSRRPAAADPAADLDAAAQRRLAMLRELRNELRDGKPAYVVFDNKTLIAIAKVRPSSLSELARVPGVGPAKLERYGAAVLAALARATVGGDLDG
jgi:DNA helicase-2/ATP-dependent DNA helicase PcrA